MFLPFAIPIVVLLVFIVVVIRRRRITTAEGMQLLGGVPAAPTLPGLAYLFPGRGSPPDPDIRKTSVTIIDPRPQSELPPGVKRTGASDEAPP